MKSLINVIPEINSGQALNLLVSSSSSSLSDLGVEDLSLRAEGLSEAEGFQDLNPKEKRCRNKFGMTRSEGFTLIELLIVIAIIGILAALLMANFIGVRQRARDAQRKSDLRQIQSALEMIRADYGCYPSSGCGVTSFPTCGSPLQVGTASVYMQKIPCDPVGVSVSYQYGGSKTQYCLRACLENTADTQKDSATFSLPADCGSIPACPSGRANYTLLNP